MHTMSRPSIRSTREPDAHDVIRYLEDVAYELRSRGLLVAAVDVHAGARLTGSLRIAGDESTAAVQCRRLTLHWHPRNGWWTERLSGRSRRRVRCLIGDPDVAAVTVACLAADLLA